MGHNFLGKFMWFSAIVTLGVLAGMFVLSSLVDAVTPPKPCTKGYTLIEAGVGVNCNGDTIIIKPLPK